jgi:putative ABC transport system substrate-binding protein
MSRVGRIIGILLALTLGEPAAMLVAAEPPPTKIYRLGYLSPSRIPANEEGFTAGLRDLGYVEGRNLTIEYRFADGQYDRLDALAAELVRLHPDAIVTVGTPATWAAKRATSTIPIVVSGAGDILGSGLVASLARPGGNITGVSHLVFELNRKRLELLKEAVPGLVRVGVLGHAMNVQNQQQWQALQPAGRELGLDLRSVMVKEPDEIAAAISGLKRDGAGALMVLSDAVLLANRRQIVDLAAEHRLPAVYEFREYVEAGGLMAYAPNIAAVARHSATFVDKVLRGANPAELPIEQATVVEFGINLATARALGLTIPPDLLARADEVIE